MSNININIKLREYQEAIINTATDNNCLVVLPTGMGKTMIALFTAMNRLEKFPRSKILFMAPTRPLASQHLKTFTKLLPDLYADMQLFTGKVKSDNRKKLWQTADIIFSTPQCIANDLKKYKINLQDVSLLIEDEAHRCLKNYDYTYVARKYLEQSKIPRILGLTASPGSDKKIIETICKNLDIEKVEIRSRYSEDVEPYIQELKTDLIKVELPEEFKIIQKYLKDLYVKKTEELQKRNLLFARATKTTLLDLQSRMIRAVSSGNKHFNLLKGMVLCGQAIRIGHALELLETQCINSLYNYLKNLFDNAKKKSEINLINDHNFSSAYLITKKMYDEKIEHPKIEMLLEILKEENKKRVIIFSQYRDTVSKIKSELDNIGINSAIFVGQQKRRNIGMSQKEQELIIEKFRQGEINCLISTSIGEEGLDLPEVDLVIFYEPVPSAIRKIQRSGRTARLKPGKIITLLTKNTMDESHYWAAFHKEKKMYSALENLKEELDREPSKEKNQLDLGKFVKKL
jgi:Fanconi anemia group M protein